MNQQPEMVDSLRSQLAAITQERDALRMEVEQWKASNEAVRDAESIRNSHLISEVNVLRDELAASRKSHA